MPCGWKNWHGTKFGIESVYLGYRKTPLNGYASSVSMFGALSKKNKTPSTI